MIVFQEFLGFPQRLIVATQWRAAISGNKPGGVQSGDQIALALDHRQTYECLRAGHVDTAVGQQVFVVEGSGGKRRNRRGRGGTIGLGNCGHQELLKIVFWGVQAG